MAERPTLDEMLDAVIGHLESQVIPAVKGDQKLYFQTLVAANLLRVAGRELELGAKHRQAEWARLNALTGESLPEPDDLQSALDARSASLCADIRAGAYDSPERQAALREHALLTATAAVEIANPKLLATLIAEMGDTPA